MITVNSFTGTNFTKFRYLCKVVVEINSSVASLLTSRCDNVARNALENTLDNFPGIVPEHFIITVHSVGDRRIINYRLGNFGRFISRGWRAWQSPLPQVAGSGGRAQETHISLVASLPVSLPPFFPVTLRPVLSHPWFFQLPFCPVFQEPFGLSRLEFLTATRVTFLETYPLFETIECEV